jgi:hypothetical protein
MSATALTLGVPARRPGRRKWIVRISTFKQQRRQKTYFRDLAALFARVFLEEFPPQEMRAQGRPGARCTRGLACKGREKGAHEHTGSAEAVRPSLRNGFNGFLRALLGDRLSCHRRRAGTNPPDLTPASGRRDHTTSPSALTPFVKGAFASTASRPASVTIASRPSVERDNRDKQVIWVRRQVKFRKIRNEGPGRFQVICPAI